MKTPYQIRIDQDLLDRVKKSAKENERSVNAEIRYLLKSALNKKLKDAIPEVVFCKCEKPRINPTNSGNFFCSKCNQKMSY